MRKKRDEELVRSSIEWFRLKNSSPKSYEIFWFQSMLELNKIEAEDGRECDDVDDDEKKK